MRASAGEGTQILLRDCASGNAAIPRGDVDLQLRWVDAAGNTTPWALPVRVPTSRDYAGEIVPSAVSAW